MNKFINLILFIYRGLFPSALRTCRFTPTCSEYFQTAVEKKGPILGTALFIKRLSSCHPYSKRQLIDPVI